MGTSLWSLSASYSCGARDDGANIAGFLKVGDAMLDQGMV
jgi:hypothetical protein